MKKFLPFLFLFLLQPVLATQVEITEVMYNLEGSDENREWIEIKFNEEINFTAWKFYEAETNHRLTFVQGNEVIPSGGHAIIARKEANFLTDYPSFNGNLFTSSFTLSNTGETLEIRNENKETVFTVTYSSDQGGSGDGNSLQLLNDGWRGCIPNPGVDSVCSESEEDPPQNDTDNPPDQDEQDSTPDEPLEEDEEDEEEFDPDWVPEDLLNAEDEEDEEPVLVYSQQQSLLDSLASAETSEQLTVKEVYSGGGNIKVSLYLLLIVSVLLNILFISTRN